MSQRTLVWWVSMPINICSLFQAATGWNKPSLTHKLKCRFLPSQCMPSTWLDALMYLQYLRFLSLQRGLWRSGADSRSLSTGLPPAECCFNCISRLKWAPCSCIYVDLGVSRHSQISFFNSLSATGKTESLQIPRRCRQEARSWELILSGLVCRISQCRGMCSVAACSVRGSPGTKN